MLRLAIVEAILEPRFDNGIKIDFLSDQKVILRKKWNCLRPFAVEIRIRQKLDLIIFSRQNVKVLFTEF